MKIKKKKRKSYFLTKKMEKCILKNAKKLTKYKCDVNM